MLYAVLAEEAGSALLHGEPGCGKSTLALKFAWQTQGAFDAVVFQLCGQRPVAEIAADMLRRAITARPEQQRRLLDAMAVCAIEGFWLPLTVEITGLTEVEGRDARNSLACGIAVANARSRPAALPLLREELRNLAPLG